MRHGSGRGNFRGGGKSGAEESCQAHIGARLELLLVFPFSASNEMATVQWVLSWVPLHGPCFSAHPQSLVVPAFFELPL